MKEPTYSLPQKREFAKRMRNDPTRAEFDLWKHLEREQMGRRFQRQALVRGFIVDFYCPTLRLAIEVDGSVHEIAPQIVLDEERERALEDWGIGVLRFTNQDVLRHMAVVLRRIRTEIEARSGLKAPSLGTVSYNSLLPSRSNRGGESVDVSRKRKPVSTVSPTRNVHVSVEPVHISNAEIAAFDRKFAVLCKQRTLDFDNRPVAERAWELKFKLQEYLAQKRRTSDELERKKLLRLA